MESEEIMLKLKGNNEEDPRRKWKTELDSTLEKICETKKRWMWVMFLFVALPGVLNGMHITSYVFFVDNNPPYCNIPELVNAGWTAHQIQNISLPVTQSLQDRGCLYYDLNYAELAKQPFEKAEQISRSVVTKEKPKLLACTDFKYENYDSVISEWNLVCDQSYYRSSIQAAYALGKLLGAFSFGIIADKTGRKNSFTLAAVCYFISGFLVLFSDSFSVFLFIRFLLGFGGMGCFSTAYTLLTEIIVGPMKTLACCLFNASYAVGMIIVAFLAYEFHYWKTLQIIMSIPTVMFPFYYWFLPESPQWLASKGRYVEAWDVVKKIDRQIVPPANLPKMYFQAPKSEAEPTPWKLFYKNLLFPFAEFMSLFSTAQLATRTIICFYVWFTISIVYFGLVINGENFNIDRYYYILLNGVLEIFSYALPIPLLSVCGRKTASLYLFTFTGAGLISILFLPETLSTVILVVALFSRFWVTSAYVIFALYTSELFPTTIRNTAIGSSVMMSHLGTLVSPYIVDILGPIKWYIPSTIFGTCAILSIFAVLVLPETKNKPLFSTVEEMNEAQ